MKKSFIPILFLTICQLSFSQVKMAQKVERVFNENIKYDSLTNSPYGEKVISLKGQNLFAYPIEERREIFKNNRFIGFYTSIDPKSPIYKPYGSIFTKYDAIAGKTFDVLDVKYRKTVESEPAYISDYVFYLELKEKDSGDIIYYKYDQVLFPFLTVGYYEKLKKNNLGIEFYYKKRFENKENDYSTGAQFEAPVLSLWKCIDVVFDNNRKGVGLILSDGSNSIIKDYDSMDYYIIPKAIGDHYKKIYGNLYTDAMNGSIKVNMPSDLVEIAWGKPDKINKTPLQEQWVYNSRNDMKYVYIRNGKVAYFN